MTTRTLYTRHCLNAHLTGYKALSLRQFVALASSIVFQSTNA